MEEMLDTFDINGNFTGVKSRKFCHGENPGVYHKPVWIWIVNSKGEILIQKRSKIKKNNPSKWDLSSAGHVEAGETCLYGCVREIYEELGIQTEEKDFVFVKQFVQQHAWELVQLYILKKDIDIKNVKLQTEEVECVKWISYNDFIKILYTDEFCSHTKEHRDLFAEILKDYTEK